MALNPALLAVTLAASAGSVDPPGIAAWLSIAGALCSWAPTNVVAAPAITPPGPVASGTTVSGFGIFVVTGASALGTSLASASGSADAPGLAKWSAIGSAIAGHIGAFGKWSGAAMVCSATGGPVSGVGAVSFGGGLLDLHTPAGSPDVPGIAAWTSIAAAILAHFTANASVLSAFASPNGGGPLTGVGILS